MYHLAQANYGQWEADVTAEQIQSFLDRSSAVLDSATNNSGWIWTAGGKYFEDERVISEFGNRRMILNMTVWASLEDLKRFVYNDIHRSVMKDRDMWFDLLENQVSVLWWVKVGHEPPMAEAKEKLDLLNEVGPSREAFTFAKPYQWQDIIETQLDRYRV